MPSVPAVPLLDPRRARRGFARAAAGYDEVAVLQREIAARMLARLDYVKIQPECLVDLGCGTGGSLAALGERYPEARIVGIDASEAMLRAGKQARFPGGQDRALLAAADAGALPLPTGAADFIWSNLMLHWLADPRPALREARRALAVDGLLMFSTFGPDTLKELRASFSDAHEHTLRFIDMHDYGDMLLECGFADPVMDAERLTMTYPCADALFDELRRNGSISAAEGRRRGLMGRRAWQGVREAYERQRVDGRLPVSFEVIYGQAWKAEPRTIEDGRAVIHFAR